MELFEEFTRRFPIINPENYVMVAWNTLNLLIINFYILELGLIVGWGDRFWRD